MTLRTVQRAHEYSGPPPPLPAEEGILNYASRDNKSGEGRKEGPAT